MLELGSHAIRDLQRGGDRIHVGTVLHSIAGALAATRPDAGAIIQGAAEPYFVKSPPVFTRLTISSVTAALGEERARELRASPPTSP